MKQATRGFAVSLLIFGFAATASLVASPASSAATADAVPTVTSVSPSSGPGSGGTIVTVMGTGLAEVTKVQFVSGSAVGVGTDLSDISAHELQITSPTGDPNNSPYDIEVTSKAGTSAANPNDEIHLHPGYFARNDLGPRIEPVDPEGGHAHHKRHRLDTRPTGPHHDM